MGMNLLAVVVLAAGCAVLVPVFLAQRASLSGILRTQRGLRRDLEALKQDLDALCTGAKGVGSHLSRIDRQLARLHERQDQLEQRDSAHREYDQAVRLIQRGADVDEIIDRCNLVRAEAELLLRLNRAESPSEGQLQRRGMRSVA